MILTRTTHHIDIHIHPDELRRIADHLDEELERQEAVLKSKVLPNEDHSYENSIHGEGVVVIFRTPKRLNSCL